MKINNLCVNFDEKVIFQDFSIEFEKNKITAVLGNSGIGKTTLLNAIAKLIPFSGEIEGVEKVSYMFQEPRLIEPLTVYDNLLYVLDKKSPDNTEKIKEILEKVELKEEINTFCHELSGGMKSRVALARAFLIPSDTLLMDEPMRSLDLGLRLRQCEVLKSLLESFPRTTLFVTHSVSEAVSVADKIIVLGETPAKVICEYVTADYEKGELMKLLTEILSK